MKPWQHGYDLDYLKQIASLYEDYNSYALSPFAEFKKNNVAESLHQGTLRLLFAKDKPISAYQIERSKVTVPIYMHGKTPLIGKKIPGDLTISKIAGKTEFLSDYLHDVGDENIWMFVWAEDETANKYALKKGFQYVAGKITTYGEVYSIYFRDKSGSRFFGGRDHPKIPYEELLSIEKLGTCDYDLIEKIATKLSILKLDFSDHYSNYNYGHAWSAISLRGYSPDPSFITKPEEMNDKWKKAHENEEFELQDTELRAKFPEVDELLNIPLGKNGFAADVHRIRFMKLKPGGGELGRHTDQVDPDARNTSGGLIRVHWPIQTNPNVEFSVWDSCGHKQTVNMKIGEFWMLDTRKPHTVINKGDTDRIHLVVDFVATSKLSDWI